jgi:hypothetical protein
MPDNTPDPTQQYLKDGRKGVRTYAPCRPNATDCVDGEWTDRYQMAVERWYPTLTTLHTGR